MRDDHLSGRFDATDAQWDHALHQLRNSDVYSLTECRGVDIPGRHRRAKDVAICWNLDSFRELGYYTTMLSHRSWQAGKHQRRGVNCVWVYVQSREYEYTLLRGVAHLPASVQGGDGWSKKLEDRDNIYAWREAIGEMGRQVEHANALLHPDQITIAADWNVDVENHAWRDRIHKAVCAPGMRVVVPPRSTHGNRIIDAHVTTLIPTKYHVAIKTTGFDHHRISLNTRTPRGKE